MSKRFAVMVILALSGSALAAAPSLTRERQAELRYLVRQDCGSCHGMTLGGGLGPALTPEALADKPVALLTATILDGRPGTAMPPGRPFLCEEETAWIVEQLTRGTLGP